MEREDENPSQPGAELKCPKCGASRAVDSERCQACGIIFAKWSAHQLGNRDIRSRPESRSGLSKPALVALLLLVTGGVLWTNIPSRGSSDDAIDAGAVQTGRDLVIHYDDGQRCLLSDWYFQYRRIYNGGTRDQNGWVVVDTNEYVETKNDDVLRFYATQGPLKGRKHSVHDYQIKEIQFEYLSKDQGSPSSRTITGVTLVTNARSFQFTPQNSPSSYRKRFVVPQAPHYFPGHFDDDYKKWRRATVAIEGTLNTECKGYARISLTSDEVPNYGIPISIEFPAI